MAKTPSLLEKAKAAKESKHKTKYSDEELELVQAWLEGEVSLFQVIQVTGNRGGVYAFLAIGARELLGKAK